VRALKHLHTDEENEYPSGRVMPNSSKSSLPMTATTTMMINVSRSALRATCRFVAVSSSPVSPRKIEVLAIGFMIAKKPMNTVAACGSKLAGLLSIHALLAIWATV
jgi:hypothetical protein